MRDSMDRNPYRGENENLNKLSPENREKLARILNDESLISETDDGTQIFQVYSNVLGPIHIKHDKSKGEVFFCFIDNDPDSLDHYNNINSIALDLATDVFRLTYPIKSDSIRYLPLNVLVQGLQVELGNSPKKAKYSPLARLEALRSIANPRLMRTPKLLEGVIEFNGHNCRVYIELFGDEYSVSLHGVSGLKRDPKQYELPGFERLMSFIDKKSGKLISYKGMDPRRKSLKLSEIDFILANMKYKPGQSSDEVSTHDEQKGEAQSNRQNLEGLFGRM